MSEVQPNRTTSAFHERWNCVLPLAGLLSLVFFVLQALFHTFEGHPEHMLWTCHLAALWIGVGLIFRWPTMNAIGLFWLLPGIPIWLYGVSTGARLLWVSCLTHISGLLFGLAGMRAMGYPKGMWWKAWLAIVAAQQLTRWMTPADANVNLSYRPGPGFGHLPYATFIVLLGLVIAIIFLLFHLLFQKLFYASAISLERGETAVPNSEQ